MKYEKVVSGLFLDRPDRFDAHVIVEGTTQTVHVKNTGRCRELLVPGALVYLSDSWASKGGPSDRKTRYDLIAVQKGSLLINMDSQAPNAAVKEWLPHSGLLPEGSTIRPEYRYGDSRIDFALFTPQLELLEVKGVTLEKDGIAFFPDAPTLRGVNHLRDLAAFPGKSTIFVLIHMEGSTSFRPNEETDPAFGQALRQAEEAGVRLLAYDCIVTPDSMIVHQPVRIEL